MANGFTDILGQAVSIFRIGESNPASNKRLFATIAVSVLLSVSGAAGAATVAGAIPGSLAVDESGAATYSIPIAVPPGTAGMQPSLSLNYSSHSGNGLLGIGWSLGGLSVIHRCPRTYAQDGVRGGVNYDANDRYCIDGQRLVAISGSYGADGTEYRTEVERFQQSHLPRHGGFGA